MSDDIPPVVTVPAPLQWSTAVAQTPDGTKVCVLQLVQAQMMVTLQLLPHDTEALAAQLAATATQGKSGLIIPTSSNGHPRKD